MPENSPRSRPRPVTYLAGFILVVAAMYWARPMLIPVALAVLLAFRLSPAVRRLQTRGLPRIPAVLLVVIAAFIVSGGIVWVITAQLAGLARDFPTYEKIARGKLEALR